MQKIKVAILKGRKELQGSSGVDYFTLNLYQELKKNMHIESTLIYGNYIFPGMFKFLHFQNLDNFDVIHNCVPGLGMFIRTKKPIITTFYDDIMFRPQILVHQLPFLKRNKLLFIKKIWSLGLAYDVKKSNRVVAISNVAKKSLENRLKIKSDKIKVIPPGVRTDLYKLMPQVKKRKEKKIIRLFYCGRLCYRKGTDLLLDAFKILKYDYNIKNIKLFLAGTIDENFNLYKEIQSRKIESDVFTIGNLTDEELAISYNLSDVFVFPSRVEGYGIPPLEALACGARVVSTKVPSVEDFKEAVKVDTDGFSIAKGIIFALKQKHNYDKIINKIKERYSQSVISNSYVKVYKEIIERRFS